MFNAEMIVFAVYLLFMVGIGIFFFVRPRHRLAPKGAERWTETGHGT